jgi:hypothetical protein
MRAGLTAKARAELYAQEQAWEKLLTIGRGRMPVPDGWFYNDIYPERDEVDNSRKVGP